MTHSFHRSPPGGLIPERRFILFILSLAYLAQQALSATVTGTLDHKQLDFPAKPPGLTNRPTIGQPEIEFSSTQAEKLGGADVTNLLVTSIADLLYHSDRFTLTRSKQPRCRCLVRLSDLAINPAGNTTKFNPGMATQVIGSFFKAKDSGMPSQLVDLSTNVNWSSDKLKLNVHCAVSVEILDAQSEAVLAQDEGDETWTNTAKAIGLELLGVTYGKGDKGISDSSGSASLSGTGADYQVSLIKLASYRALCKLLPTLDTKLLELTDAPPQKKEANELATATLFPTDSGEKLFCSNCGRPVNPGNKFCTHCGTQINK
jgi:hypothetical protein